MRVQQLALQTSKMDWIKSKKRMNPTLIVFPDGTNLSAAIHYNTLIEHALSQCGRLKDRFTIIDTISKTELRNISSDELKFGAAYYPDLNTALEYRFGEQDVSIHHQLIVEGESPNPTGPLDNETLDAIKANNSALYNAIKLELSKIRVVLPPSSSIAGIYAKVDNERGVWKAPANVAMSNVLSLVAKITNQEQDELNVDPTGGKSINAIRAFSGRGILVWGARTLAGNDNEWRYISVRRFFNMVEESIQKSTAWVVFEPNDANTWLRVKGMIENFLNGLWRQGALVGAKPQQAYFVNVGLGTTMTPQDILEGRMNVEIGLATSRPAEFIILKFSHKLQEA